MRDRFDNLIAREVKGRCCGIKNPSRSTARGRNGWFCGRSQDVTVLQPLSLGVQSGHETCGVACITALCVGVCILAHLLGDGVVVKGDTTEVESQTGWQHLESRNGNRGNDKWLLRFGRGGKD